MKKFFAGIVAATLISAPVQAGDWHAQAAGVQAGAFAGARVTLPLGGKRNAQPRAAFAVAPMQRSVSADGMVHSRIGEGVALSFTRDRGLNLTLAGVRADRALGLVREGQNSTDQKLGLSTGGKIAIGVGAALLAGAVVFAVVTHCDESDSSDDCP